MVETRLNIDDYTARVLDVVKGKFGLKNRGEALQKLDAMYESRMKKHPNRVMTDAELKKLLRLK